MDINRAESALLELKITAIKHLSYEDFLLVLGDKKDTIQKGTHIMNCDEYCVDKAIVNRGRFSELHWPWGGGGARGITLHNNIDVSG